MGVCWKGGHLLKSCSLGFEVQVDHPHPHVVKCMQFLRGENISTYTLSVLQVSYLMPSHTNTHTPYTANKDLAQMAYFMAHNRCATPPVSLLPLSSITFSSPLHACPPSLSPPCELASPRLLTAACQLVAVGVGLVLPATHTLWHWHIRTWSTTSLASHWLKACMACMPACCL